MGINEREYWKEHRHNHCPRQKQSDGFPAGHSGGLAGGTVDQYQKVMILIPETLHRFLPAVVITVVVGLIVNPPDELTDLPFVLVLI